MDSWMPWTVVRNFIRAFSPTLILAITWDLWRNLSHSSSMNSWAVITDGVSLGTVASVRLVPPLAGAHEQLKYYLRWKWEALIASSIFLALLLFHRLPHLSALDILLALTGCAFYADLSRACRIDIELSRKTAAIAFVYGAITAFVSDTVSSIARIREGTFPWRDAMYFTVLMIVLLAILGLKWWGQGREKLPEIQELGLNRQNHS